jgi:hypothetical protein
MTNGWLTIPEDVLIQEVGDELVLLNLRTEQYYGLNVSARRFLELSRKSVSRDLAVCQISSEFGISQELAAVDLDSLISGLQLRGLVVVAR